MSDQPTCRLKAIPIVTTVATVIRSAPGGKRLLVPRPFLKVAA